MNMESYLPKLVLITSSLLSMSCTSHTSIDEKGRTVVHHFGYVQVIKPPLIDLNNEMNVTGVTTFGLTVQDGITLGYKENKTISVPLDCRVLVILENKEQLDRFIKHINNIEGEEICSTVSP
jgi:hypothetical protein